MPHTPAVNRYRPPAIALHWLIALLIFGGYGLGLVMIGLPASPEKLRYFSFHKWMGATVVLLALLRAAWRLTHRPPPLPAGARAWEHLAAHATHGLLYLLMFAIPISGWLHSSAAGYSLVYLGLIPVPDLIGKNEALAEVFGQAHGWLNTALLALLLLHVAAAAQHHWLRRDDIVRRIVPRAGNGGWALLATLAGAGATAGLLWLFASALSTAQQREHEQAAAAPAAATAAVAASGELSAEFRQMNVGVTGNFTAFKADTLVFDPADLASAQATISVDMSSFDIGDADYNAEVRKPEWFDTAAFPQARFVSESVSRLADGSFQAQGQLTIKGKSLPITADFTLADENGQRTYTGSARLLRSAYGIGDPSWDGVLEDGVLVRFRLIVPKP